MTTIEAMKYALESLDYCVQQAGPCEHDVGHCVCKESISANALREAIAREEAQSVEPYAWARFLRNGKPGGTITVFEKPSDPKNWVELFTHHAPAKHPLPTECEALILKMRAIACATPGWSAMLNSAADMLESDHIAGVSKLVPLTFDEVETMYHGSISRLAFARAVERHHGIGWKP